MLRQIDVHNICRSVTCVKTLVVWSPSVKALLQHLVKCPCKKSAALPCGVTHPGRGLSTRDTWPVCVCHASCTRSLLEEHMTQLTLSSTSLVNADEGKNGQWAELHKTSFITEKEVVAFLVRASEGSYSWSKVPFLWLLFSHKLLPIEWLNLHSSLHLLTTSRAESSGSGEGGP